MFKKIFKMTFGNEKCIPGTRSVENANSTLIIKMMDSPFPSLVPTTWEIALKVVAYVASMFLAIVGNSVVLLIVLLNKKMRTTTNVLLLNLAVSDLMVGAFCMWIHMGNQITDNWPFGPFLCKFSTFTQVMSLTASVLSLTVISVERLIAVVYPFRHHWSPIVSAVIVGFTWLISIATASPHLFIRKLSVLRWRDKTQIYCAENWEFYYKDKNCSKWQPDKRVYYVVEGVVMYFIPVTVMIVAYLVIAIKLLSRKTPGIVTMASMTSQEKSKWKVTKMLAVVLVAFIVCWTPQQIMLIYEQFYATDNTKSYKTGRYIAIFIAYFNSALNPILYGGFNKNFKEGFLEAFKCILVKKRNKIGTESTVQPWSTKKQIPAASNSNDRNANTDSQDRPCAGPSQRSQDLHTPLCCKQDSRSICTLTDPLLIETLAEQESPNMC